METPFPKSSDVLACAPIFGKYSYAIAKYH